MKNICILLFLMLQDVAYSQKNESERISFVSPAKDTLWLLNNETGRSIAYSWKNYEDTQEQKKPVIVLVNALPLDRYCYTNNKKKNEKRRKK